MSFVIAAQMYTIRDHCKTPQDVAASLKKLRDIGFTAVQVSGICAMDPADIRRILDDLGMVCSVTHRGLEQLESMDQVIEEHEILGCSLTAIGGFGWKDTTRADWEAFVKKYGQLGHDLAERGLRIGYHNHAHELINFEDWGKGGGPDRTPMGLLLRQMDPAVWYEFDTYWIAHAGGDPAWHIEQAAGRIPVVHVKDMGFSAERQPVMCEVGAGNLNWPRILQACRVAGVQCLAIERDNGELDPFESLRISRENLLAMGAG